MASPSPYVSVVPDFHIRGAITAPGLKRYNVMKAKAFKKVHRIVEKYGTSLLDGSRAVIDHTGRVGGAQGLGVLLAEALLAEDKENAEMVGLLWITQCHDASKRIKPFLQTLSNRGRIDLARPGIVLLRDIAQAVWRKRRIATADRVEAIRSAGGSQAEMDAVAPVDPHKELSDNLPDLNTLSKQLYEQIEDSYTGAGPAELHIARAWKQVGIGLMVAAQGLDGATKSFQDVQDALLDILTTIPETRSWAADILLSQLTSIGRNESTHWGEVPDRGWLRILDTTINLLSDRETPWVLGRMADAKQQLKEQLGPQGLLDGYRPFFEQIDSLAVGLLWRHPHIEIDALLAPERSMVARLIDASPGLSTARMEFLEQGVSINQRMSPLSARYAQEAARAFDQIFQWIGCDRADGMSEATHQTLSAIDDIGRRGGHSAPALRSALDYWTLIRTSSPNEANQQQTQQRDAAPPRKRTV